MVEWSEVPSQERVHYVHNLFLVSTEQTESESEISTLTLHMTAVRLVTVVRDAMRCDEMRIEEKIKQQETRNKINMAVYVIIMYSERKENEKNTRHITLCLYSLPYSLINI